MNFTVDLRLKTELSDSRFKAADVLWLRITRSVVTCHCRQVSASASESKPASEHEDRRQTISGSLEFEDSN